MKKKREKGYLNGTRVYLSGPMDFVASRAEEKKNGWRIRVRQFLQSYGATVFDPWEKPAVRGLHEYGKEDWDRYVSVRDENESVTVVTPRAGSKGKYWNEDDRSGGGDYITVCAPDKKLIDDANNPDNDESINDASYVIVYRSAGGRILLAGDAHDKTWDYVLKHYEGFLENCEFMVAPHHGRDSDRSWEFLDKIKPKFSVLGCASSKHLAYHAWNSRKLEKITQNQAGNISIYPNSKGLDIYVENENFASAYGGNTSKTDGYGNFYLKKVEKGK